MAGLGGAWFNKVSGADTAYNSPKKWGTGVNPVHAIRTGGEGRGGNAQADDLGTIPEGLVTEELGYMAEDSGDTIFGYGFDTGTADHPNWGTDDREVMSPDYPTYGPTKSGIPMGTKLRSLDHGSRATSTAKATQPDNAISQGWQNKQTGEVVDAFVSDTSQLFMQTSMTQRDQVRRGSQRSSSASDYSADVPSRQAPMRTKVYGHTEVRREAMFPRQQEPIIRGMISRIVGSNNPRDMAPNAMYRSTPYHRTPPGDPYLGPDIDGGNNDWISNGYGYTAEDTNY